MRLGIMQPYFFPNLAHFALIAATDNWVVFDVTQFTRKSWMSRNRILHPKEGWNYITVPLRKTNLETRIHEVRVADMQSARKSLQGKLSHYRKNAPFFREVVDLVDRVFDDVDGDSLVALNTSSLKQVCIYLDVPFEYRICSDMGLEFPDQMGPGDWAPFICGELGATSYVNPAGGRALFDPSDFEQHGTQLCFAEFAPFIYDTGPFEFTEGLSILDVLMWNPPDLVRQVLQNNTRLDVVGAHS